MYIRANVPEINYEMLQQTAVAQTLSLSIFALGTMQLLFYALENYSIVNQFSQ